MPCFPASIQAPVKGYCRPAGWMSGCKSFHSHAECWQIDAGLSKCIDEILNVVENLNEVEHPNEYYVNKVDYQKRWIQIYCYSSTGWLDVLEITFLPNGENASYAKVESVSTGALPAWLPFGFLCDMILCWLPFGDNGSNRNQCEAIRHALPFHAALLNEQETDKLLGRQQTSTCSSYLTEKAKLK